MPHSLECVKENKLSTISLVFSGLGMNCIVQTILANNIPFRTSQDIYLFLPHIAYNDKITLPRGNCKYFWLLIQLLIDRLEPVSNIIYLYLIVYVSIQY